MSDYLVIWKIDAEGYDSPRDAAAYARSLQQRPGAEVGCFTVIDKATDEEVQVDLDLRWTVVCDTPMADGGLFNLGNWPTRESAELAARNLDEMGKQGMGNCTLPHRVEERT